MITRCKHCNAILALNENAWAAQTGMFCSKECGVEDAVSLYDEGTDRLLSYADKLAKADGFFDDIAEEISREDYGARLERWTAYSSSHDITTVFNSVYEGDTLIATRVTGFYFGPDDLAATDKFDGKTEALFVV